MIICLLTVTIQHKSCEILIVYIFPVKNLLIDSLLTLIVESAYSNVVRWAKYTRLLLQNWYGGSCEANHYGQCCHQGLQGSYFWFVISSFKTLYIKSTGPATVLTLSEMRSWWTAWNGEMHWLFSSLSMEAWQTWQYKYYHSFLSWW